MDADRIGARRRPNNSMQLTALRAAADAERHAHVALDSRGKKPFFLGSST